MVERMSNEEHAAFIKECTRLGVSIVRSMLDVKGVRRISDMPLVDRINFLAELTRTVRK